VLFNDTHSGSPVVTIESAPTNGGAVAETNGTITYTNNGTIGADSFVYRITEGGATDTATVNISVKVPSVGATSSFSMSNTGYDSSPESDGEPACEYLLTITKYHDGVFTYPTLADTIYNESSGTTAFNGQDRYWAIAGGRTIRIDASGEVTDVWICGAGNA
jgi:hypothetical protein